VIDGLCPFFVIGRLRVRISTPHSTVTDVAYILIAKGYFHILTHPSFEVSLPVALMISRLYI